MLEGSTCTIMRIFLVDRPKPHAVHEVSHPVTADRDSISGQIAHHPAAAAAGILQLERIDPGHDAQRRLPQRCRAVVERGHWQVQQRALAADPELGMVLIDQLA
jgi:hypothetical protein